MDNTNDQLFLKFVGSCHAESRFNFEHNAYPILQELIPHDGFMYGVVDVATGRILRLVNKGFPQDCLDAVERFEGDLVCPLVRKWGGISKPMHYSHPVSGGRFSLRCGPLTRYAE